LALFAYLGLTLFPIFVSVGLFLLYEAISGNQLPVLELAVFMLVLRQINVFTLSTLFHRSYSHRQFDYHPWVEHPLRVWNWVWMGTGGRAWAILHRWHHAKTDTDEDPHSPTKEGGSLWNVVAQTGRSYQHCLHNPEQYRRYEAKLPDDKLEHAIRKLELLPPHRLPHDVDRRHLDQPVPRRHPRLGRGAAPQPPLPPRARQLCCSVMGVGPWLRGAVAAE
jgi:fatty-acid desaturase